MRAALSRNLVAILLFSSLCPAAFDVAAQKDAGKQGATDEKFGNKTLTEEMLGKQLDAEVEEAIELQENREDVPKAIISKVVDAAPAAELASGDGDISTTGACAGDYDTFCKTTRPGEGRIAACFTKQMQGEEKGNVSGRTVSENCKVELAKFRADRATNINKDLPLARACRQDVKKYCAKQRKTKDPGLILACLREVEPKLSKRCANEVFRTQLEAAVDFDADAQLQKYCGADADRLCDSVTPGAGRIQECLWAHVRDDPEQVGWECREDLFRQEVENVDDIRLSPVLLRVCQAEKQHFCADVPAGNARITTCLEAHRQDKGFGSECRAQLELVMERRSMDFRLNAPLKMACEKDIKAVCGQALSRLDTVQSYDAKVIRCLQNFKDELKTPECIQQVHKVTEQASQDVRFNYPLASECADDRKKLCPNEQPGSARVIRCLQHSRDQLSFECKAAMFDQEQEMSEDIDFKYPLKKACSAEISTFCKDVPHGHARIVRCLQESMEDSKMGSECRAQVQEDLVRSSQDYRLNFRLREACEFDVVALCPDACKDANSHACGGKALRCLTDHAEDIQDPTCRVEVLYFEKMEVNDFRNDALLAEACHMDVQKFCPKVQPGEGRVHECLRARREELSEACRQEELHLNIMQAQDVRLRPKLKKMCSDEIAVFCGNVKPGKGRIMQCLQQNLGAPDFGSACHEQISVREKAMQEDWQEDYGVAAACKAEVDTHCSEAKNRPHSGAEVLKCLLAQQTLPKLGKNCEAQVSRAARMALWEYAPGASLTAACDMDVRLSCEKAAANHKKGVFSIGAVGRCLARKLASGSSLQPQCQDVVLAAAPSDARAAVSTSAAQELLKGKLKQLQQRAQSAAASSETLTKAKMVNPQVRGAGMITLTGWIAAAAIAAMAMVVIVGVFYGARRLLQPTRPYTVLRTDELRDGDA